MRDESNPCEFGHELDRFALAELPPARLQEIRLHIETCTTCAREVDQWLELVAAADGRREEILANAAPAEEALSAFWLELDRTAAAEPTSGRGAPVQWALRKHAMLAALAAMFLVTVVVLPFTLPDDRGQLRTPPSSPVSIASKGEVREVDLTGWETWDLLARDRETLMNDGQLQVRLMPGAEIAGEIDESTGNRRLRVTRGAIAFSNPGAPVIIEADGIQTVVDGGSSGAIARDVDGGGATTRTRIGIRSGRAVLSDVTPGGPRIDDGALEVGAGQAVTLESGGSGSPELVDIGDLGGDPLPPEPPAGTMLEPSGTLVEVEHPDGDPGGPIGTAIDGQGGGLAVGTVQILLPTESFSAGDVLPIDIIVSVGDPGLGAYYLELDFQPRDSDLRVELARPPTTVIDGTAGSPLLQSFDRDSQVLRIADTNTRSLEPIGRGTFRVLSFDVRVLEGSPGLHTVGGAVHQLLDVDAQDIEPVQLQVRNSISIRRE